VGADDRRPPLSGNLGTRRGEIEVEGKVAARRRVVDNPTYGARQVWGAALGEVPDVRGVDRADDGRSPNPIRRI
jgi:hypothetical protein